MKRQRGAYLVMMTVLIVILIGIAALAIDVGRLLVMRSEMQNGVDAAALAAAGELDGNSNAQSRARAAARDLLQHDARFARISALLGEDGLPDSAFQFYCAIGSITDIAQSDPGFASFCSGSPDPDDPNKVFASSNTDTHYVQVSLDPALVGDGDRFTADLIFLPVLGAIGVNTAQTADMSARALAGRSFFTCNYPPMAMCDPWEGTGSHFRDSMPVGGHIELRQQGGNFWAPGNFGFLQPKGGGSGANVLAQHLANPENIGCSPPIVTSQPGTVAQPSRRAINTRFDQYQGPGLNPSDHPPAPNIIGYPEDQTLLSIDGRFGSGDWDVVGYWNEKHPGETIPMGWNNANPPLRWDVYNHEIDSNQIPEAPGNPPGAPERRLITVAVLSCEALNFQGKSTAVVFPRDGFAEMFIMDEAKAPGGPDGLQLFAEFIRWVEGEQQNFFVDVQLYE